MGGEGHHQPEDLEGQERRYWGFGNEHEPLAGMREADIDPENPPDVTIIPQDFTMEAFVTDDLDAAEAMTYNEYAQVLEAIIPTTGELYTADDLNVISWEQYGTSMLQDAIFASEAWLARGQRGYRGQVPEGLVRGLDLLPRQLRGMRRHRAQARRQASQGPPDVAAQRGQRAYLAVPDGIGLMDPAAFDRTVQVALDGKIPPSRSRARPAATTWPRRRSPHWKRRHQGRIVAEGGRHPHRGRQVGRTRLKLERPAPQEPAVQPLKARTDEAY